MKEANVSVPAQMPKLVRKRGQLALPLDICFICDVAIGFWMPAAIIGQVLLLYIKRNFKIPNNFVTRSQNPS